MKKIDNYETYEFPNGFRLLWQKTPSNTIFGNLRINHGALHEKEGEEGIAHFLEHMIVEGGTEKYTPEEQARIEGMFGYENAFTTRTLTMIPYGMIPSDLEKYLDISSQMVFYPRLDAKIISQQKEVVLREIARKKGSPDFKDFYRFFLPNLTRNRDHSYFILGEESIIQNLTEKKLREFHQRGYSPNNMILMLAGDLPKNVIDMAGKYFADVKSGSGHPFEYSRVFPLTSRAIQYSTAEDLLNKENPEESNAYLRIGVVVPDEYHKDSLDLEVIANLFGEISLKKRIRSEEGMAYSIGSGYDGENKFGYFGVSGKVHAKRKEKAIDIIFEELEKLKNSLQEESEIERAKRRITYEIANGSGDSVFSDMMHIDPINISSIVKMDYDLNGRMPIKERLSRIKQVNSNTIQRVANDYIPSDREKDNYVLLVRDPLKK